MNSEAYSHIILGSRSPQRKELLGLLVPASSIIVRPPTSQAEPGFDDVHDWSGIEQRLREIVRLKLDDVRRQCAADGSRPNDIVLCADTVIVASGEEGRLVVLGQPPEDDNWQAVVREWFRRYYRGRTHWAVTAVGVVPVATAGASAARCAPATPPREVIVKSAVTFGEFDDSLLEWYLSTGESRGKAGGYALQGAASIFVTRIEGSPSNVVGLPLLETRELLAAAVPSCARP
jgi:septum formation protein